MDVRRKRSAHLRRLSASKRMEFFKKQEGEERINLDRMRTMMNQENQDEKLEQNEELANLRADTAIEKSLISADVKLASDKAKAKDVRILKGPKS